MPTQKICERCGYMSSKDVCKACVLLEGLNRGLPQLGIGKETRQARMVSKAILAFDKLYLITLFFSLFPASTARRSRHVEASSHNCTALFRDQKGCGRTRCCHTSRSFSSIHATTPRAHRYPGTSWKDWKERSELVDSKGGAKIEYCTYIVTKVDTTIMIGKETSDSRIFLHPSSVRIRIKAILICSPQIMQSWSL